MTPFDPLQLPLRGSHLIEASAGTGKTWTIALLYVRLILGHGGQPARLPADILVLTYTEAAAQELRERIRARLAQVARLFADGAHGALDLLDLGPAPDPVLLDLRAAFAPDAWANCAQTLALAAQGMDEAAISTIHAWCARVLKEHAFAGGHLFEQEIEQNQDERLRAVVWDYWRAQVADLPAAALAEVRAVWSQPDALLPLARAVSQADALEAEVENQPLQVACEGALAARAAALEALKAPWRTDAGALLAWLETIKSQWGVSAAHWRRWVGQLRAWAEDPQQEALDLKTGWTRLTVDDMRARWKGAEPAPTHPLLEALAELRTALAELPQVREAALAQALGWLSARLRQSERADAVMGFQGLLNGVDAALHGPQGDLLARTLHGQFPVVLIDEFQDTDPVQYRIFNRIYQVAENREDAAVILIGDPKQAIYGFRGADVHTYLRAVRDCGTRVHTLACNHRSTHTLVEAVNALFARRPQFPTGIAGDTIDFAPVGAQGLDSAWVRGGQPVAALTACNLGDADPGTPLTVTEYGLRAAQACAVRIAQLLADASASGAWRLADGTRRNAQPGDVAVLVNTRKEADLMRDALARHGVRSVYLSERESVFASAVAPDVARCLRAAWQPEDEGALRAALASRLLGRSIAALDDLVENEQAWDAEVARFRGYQALWQTRGVLPMLLALLRDFDVPARCLADAESGARRLTDCLHLAELLQQASVCLDGPRALLRDCERRCLQPDGAEEGHLRLESDESLVRIVTIHKSKGLEYPLVFLPFACRGHRKETVSGPCQLVVDGVRRWVMQPDGAQQAQLQGEQLGEAVRKLYVALTRARHAVWIGLATLRDSERSGLGHVLGVPVHTGWAELVARHPAHFAWDRAPMDDAVQLARPAAHLGVARTMPRPALGEPWWIASYTGLLRGLDAHGHAPAVAPDSALEEVLIEGRDVAQPPRPEAEDGPQAADAAADPCPPALRALPRGSETGTFLHGLLEWAGQRAFRDLDGARDLVARRCAVRGWQAHIDPLHAWLCDYAATAWRLPLEGAPTLRLSQVAACTPEMEFWFPVAQVDVGALDRLITAGAFPGVARPALAGGQLNGFFKGFIDLVVQADGRYYLLDYKSNFLGERARDYAPAALVGACCQARYDVQMMVYCLALHRLLRQRLPGYDVARHLGGVVYHFLRGADAPGQGLLAWRPPADLVVALDGLMRSVREEGA